MTLSCISLSRRRLGRLCLLLGFLTTGLLIAALLGDYSQSDIRNIFLNPVNLYRGGSSAQNHDHDQCLANFPGREDMCNAQNQDFAVPFPDKNLPAEPEDDKQDSGSIGGGELRLTTIPHNAFTHGFTIFDELYLRDGTLYVVTPNRKSFPRLPDMLAKPIQRKPGVSVVPTSSEMQFIKPEHARGILGDHILRMSGFTVLLYEPQQFMDHYYHWWGEIVLGLWRVYSKLGVREDGSMSPLPFPKRFMVPFVEESGWRDHASVNGPLMRVAFPGVPVESGHHWQDLMELDTTHVFSRVMVVNREAAHKHPFGNLWFKMIAGTMNITVPDDFWDPIRRSLLTNMLGYIPRFDEYGSVIYPEKVATSAPVLTYISRQKGGRRLARADHEALVEELMMLEAHGFCEVQVVQMEDIPLKQQIELAARTTIMLAVHGNGLTHQLWMPPSPKSTVIEMLIPGGYVYDYELLARNLGHKHYAVWNDTYITYPKGKTHKGIKYPPGFQGNEIPVWAETVANIVRQRLSGGEVGAFAYTRVRTY